MIGELIGDWIKGILIDGITGNLSGLFEHGQYESRAKSLRMSAYPAGVEQRHLQYAA